MDSIIFFCSIFGAGVCLRMAAEYLNCLSGYYLIVAGLLSACSTFLIAAGIVFNQTASIAMGVLCLILSSYSFICYRKF